MIQFHVSTSELHYDYQMIPFEFPIAYQRTMSKIKYRKRTEQDILEQT